MPHPHIPAFARRIAPRAVAPRDAARHPTAHHTPLQPVRGEA